MKIITLNINGIRAGERKGFFQWLKKQRADIVCLQEIKAQPDQIKADAFWPDNFHCYYHTADKKGYSGVAVYSRAKPDEVDYGVNWPEFDCEGRFLEVRFGDLYVSSLYMPSGSSKEERQDFKKAQSVNC